MGKIGKASFIFNNAFIKETSSVTGPLEAKGPLKDYYDYSFSNLHCNKASWEKAEIELFERAITTVKNKLNYNDSDFDLLISGDLNNQIAISSYVMRHFDIPSIGIYGACTTCAEGLITAATFLEAGYGKNIISVTGSHNCTSERQFRYPTEYGGQKPTSTTSTVTGAGAFVVSSDESDIILTKATIGKVIDSKLKDVQDMGRSMTLAAYDTLKQHLIDFNTTVDEYDLIVTGDLSKFGSIVLKDLMLLDNIELKENYNDCGLMVYDIDKQRVFAGGSGCGCSAIATAGFICHEIKKGKYNKVLLIATGALMNPIMIAQKESIPVLAHAVVLERNV